MFPSVILAYRAVTSFSNYHPFSPSRTVECSTAVVANSHLKTLFNADDCVHIPYSIAEPFYRFAQLVICGCWSKKNRSNEPSVAPATLHGNCVAQPYGLGSIRLGELSPGL